MKGPSAKYNRERMFRGVQLGVEDLYLLEGFQIGYFPGWVSERDLAAVLRAYPSIKRFLEAKCPSISSFVEEATAGFGPAADQRELAECEDRLVWTIADVLVYNKCPEAYDQQEFHGWDFREVTSITSLDDKVVVDVGAGTGRVALEAALSARHVFAVEPVARLRGFVREKASNAGYEHVYVVDGFGHDVPLPNDVADVLITSHALGWRLEDELAEFERLVKPGGTIIHCPGTAENEREQDQHLRLVSPEWSYEFARFKEADGWKRKYRKQV